MFCTVSLSVFRFAAEKLGCRGGSARLAAQWGLSVWAVPRVPIRAPYATTALPMRQ